MFDVSVDQGNEIESRPPGFEMIRCSEHENPRPLEWDEAAVV
jgi:hypothetical protein